MMECHKQNLLQWTQMEELVQLQASRSQLTDLTLNTIKFVHVKFVTIPQIAIDLHSMDKFQAA